MGFKFLDRTYNDAIGRTLGVTQKLNKCKNNYDVFSDYL